MSVLCAKMLPPMVICVQKLMVPANTRAGLKINANGIARKSAKVHARRVRHAATMIAWAVAVDRNLKIVYHVVLLSSTVMVNDSVWMPATQTAIW